MRRSLGFRLGWLAATNDGRCIIFWVLAGLMLVFSISYGPGEPLLTRTANQQISELANKADYQNINNPWWDADKSLIQTSWSEPVPPAKTASEKSWWPWVITGLLFVLSIIYTPIAKREEAIEAGRDAWEYLMAKTETGEAKGKAAEEGKQASASSIVEKISQQVGWRKLISIDVLGQFAGNFIQRWLFKRR